MTDIEKILIAVKEELEIARKENLEFYATDYDTGIIEGLERAVRSIAEIYKLDVKEK